MPLHVALVGLGPIGVELGKVIAARSDMRIVAAVDIAPQWIGHRLTELVPKSPPEVMIEASLERALSRKVDALALTTSSRFRHVVTDLETAIASKVHVVSSCEELSAPAVDPENWACLDGLAKSANVTVLGTGVNPGFVMDRLVLQLAGACVQVDRVEVERVVDAAKRRGPLRKKVGEGLTVEAFRAGVAAGTLGHVGLRESATLIATGLGWKMERYDETIDPVVHPEGHCLGLRQLGRGFVDGEEKITLRLEMSVHAANPGDRIRLASDPPVDLEIRSGLHGDRATLGTLVNALARISRAPRGLVTVADVFA